MSKLALVMLIMIAIGDINISADVAFPTDAFNILPSSTFTPEPVLPDGSVVAESKNEFGMRFYVIQTEDNNTYFLVISGSNVYFLDAVKDEDLVSLMKPAAKEEIAYNSTVSSITVTPKPLEKEEETTSPPSAPKINASYIAIGGGLLLFTVAAVYIKIIRPKNKKAVNMAMPEPQPEDDEDDYNNFDPTSQPDYEEETELPEQPIKQTETKADFSDDEDDFEY